MHESFLRITGAVRQHHAFSLVELSIVLVILGLLTGGVLAGQSLIRAAELRSLTTDYMKFHTAIYSFRDRYFALPGDMANATKFWGVAAGDGKSANAPCKTTKTTDGKTCDGDDNGQISCNWVGCSFYEMNRGWQHLANAGLIEGNYVGAPAPSYFESGVNVPASRIAAGSMWDMIYFASDTGSTTGFASKEGHKMRIQGGTSSYYLTPSEAWNVDLKLDDGRPNLGSVVSLKGNATYPCSTTAGQPVSADADTQYSVASATVSCWLMFGF